MVDAYEETHQPPLPKRYSKHAPYGIIICQLLSSVLFPKFTYKRRVRWFQGLVLVVTYFSYMNFHISRKPLSVVKPILHRECKDVKPEPGQSTKGKFWCSWKPFDTENGNTLLGILDSCFLISYAVCLFFSGMIGDRVNARLFLVGGMLGGTCFCFMFGLGHDINVHNMWYFMVIQVLSGVVHSTGWPGMVSVVGHWCPASSRGRVFGIWTSQTAVGNILGTLLSSWTVEKNWGKSFYYPALFFLIMTLILYLFLPESPVVVDCFVNIDNLTSEQIAARKSLIAASGGYKPVPFTQALLIPGVIQFALSLFFAKLVTYTFLFWLPMYIDNSTSLSPAAAGRLSTIFDVGGAVGAGVAGFFSDFTDAPAAVCVVFYLLCIPFVFLYSYCGSLSSVINVITLFFVGLLCNGPYCLITTAISAELGMHPSLEGNSKALATVTAIINGTGSIGSAVGPALAGYITSVGTWKHVFYLLVCCDVLGILMIISITKDEIKHKVKARKEQMLKKDSAGSPPPPAPSSPTGPSSSATTLPLRLHPSDPTLH